MVQRLPSLTETDVASSAFRRPVFPTDLFLLCRTNVSPSPPGAWKTAVHTSLSRVTVFCLIPSPHQASGQPPPDSRPRHLGGLGCVSRGPTGRLPPGMQTASRRRGSHTCSASPADLVDRAAPPPAAENTVTAWKAALGSRPIASCPTLPPTSAPRVLPAVHAGLSRTSVSPDSHCVCPSVSGSAGSGSLQAGARRSFLWLDRVRFAGTPLGHLSTDGHLGHFHSSGGFTTLRTPVCKGSWGHTFSLLFSGHLRSHEARNCPAK